VQSFDLFYLSAVCLTTLSVPDTLGGASNGRITVNNELERIWK
jgi:hypothetical protein